MQGVYRALSANAKFMSAANARQIAFMSACVIELFGLDAAAAYQHAFEHIRQLSVLMRNALTNKEKDAYKEVHQRDRDLCCAVAT